MSTRVAETPHSALGLSAEDLASMHRLLLTSRLLDEAALRQNRMGRAPFVVPAAGHEGCQIGTAWAMRRGTDIWLPYYRDLGIVLSAGMTPVRGLPRGLREGRGPLLGRPPDAGALGLAPPRDHHRLVPDRDPGPARGGDRVRREVPGRGRGRRLLVRRRRHERGRLARGLELRRDPPPPRDLRLREQPVRDQRPAVQADGGEGRREPRRGLRVPRGRGRRQRRPRVLRGDEDRPRAGAGRRGTDADRVQDLPVHAAHVRRRRQELPLARGGRAGEGPRPAGPVRRLPPRARPAGRRGGRGAPRRGQGGDRRGDPRRLGRARPRSRHRAPPRVPGGGRGDREERGHRRPGRAPRRDGATTSGSCCSARTSARAAACSGSPTAGWRSSARNG